MPVGFIVDPKRKKKERRREEENRRRKRKRGEKGTKLKGTNLPPISLFEIPPP